MGTGLIPSTEIGFPADVAPLPMLIPGIELELAELVDPDAAVVEAFLSALAHPATSVASARNAAARRAGLLNLCSPNM